MKPNASTEYVDQKVGDRITGVYCRHGISEAIFSKWKSKFADM